MFDGHVADDALGPLDVEVSAQRVVHLAKVAEGCSGKERGSSLRYALGAHIPVSGRAAGIRKPSA